MTDSIPGATKAPTVMSMAAVNHKAKKSNHGEVHAPEALHSVASTTVTLSSAGVVAAAADKKTAGLPVQMAQGGKGK